MLADEDLIENLSTVHAWMRYVSVCGISIEKQFIFIYEIEKRKCINSFVQPSITHLLMTFWFELINNLDLLSLWPSLLLQSNQKWKSIKKEEKLKINIKKSLRQMKKKKENEEERYLKNQIKKKRIYSWDIMITYGSLFCGLDSS